MGSDPSASGGGRRGLYLSHELCLGHDPSALLPGHPDTPRRLEEVERLLGSLDWLGWRRKEAPRAQEEDVEAVHHPEHVAMVRELSASGGGSIDADTYV